MTGKVDAAFIFGATSPCPKVQDTDRSGSLAVLRTTESVCSWVGFLYREEEGWRTALAAAVPGKGEGWEVG